MPRRIVVFDTETYTQSGDENPGCVQCKFRCACLSLWTVNKGVYRRKRTWHVDSIAAFWTVLQTITSERETTWIIAHNIGFDLTVLHFWDLFERGIFDTTNQPAETVETDDGNEEVVKDEKGFVVLSDPPVF